MKNKKLSLEDFKSFSKEMKGDIEVAENELIKEIEKLHRRIEMKLKEIYKLLGLENSYEKNLEKLQEAYKKQLKISDEVIMNMLDKKYKTSYKRFKEIKKEVVSQKTHFENNVRDFDSRTLKEEQILSKNKELSSRTRDKIEDELSEITYEIRHIENEKTHFKYFKSTGLSSFESLKRSYGNLVNYIKTYRKGETNG